MFSWLGPWEIAIILIVAVVLFGKRLPELGRTLGKGIVAFKSGVNEMKDEISKAAEKDVSADKSTEDDTGDGKDSGK